VKLIIDAKPLAQAVATVARSIPVRPPVPVLAGATLTCDDTLTVGGFDYDSATRVELPVTVLDPGAALVSGRLLGDIAKALPPNRAVEIVTDASRATLTAGKSRFSLPLLPLDDYPQLPAVPDEAGRIDTAALVDAIGRVCPSAGHDDSLPMLTGCRMEINGPRITLASTDRFRLAVAELDWTPTDPDLTAGLLVPARSLTDMAKTIAGTATVGLLMAAGHPMLGVTADGVQATTRLLDAEFPRYRQLIPTEHTTTVRVDVGELTAAVKRVALVAGRVAQVRLACTDGHITVTAGGDDQGDAEETLDATVAGAPLTICFNPAYLLDGLAALDTVTAVWELTTPTRPALLHPDEGGSATTVLLMPVRGNG
jgi:DNA polymerase-3 subunit beta